MTARELAEYTGREMWLCRRALGEFVAREGRLPTGPEALKARQDLGGFRHDYVAVLGALQTAVERVPVVSREIV